MTRIVRTAYRYKRPPGKRKAVALEVPAVVRAGKPGQRSDKTTSDRTMQSDGPTGLSGIDHRSDDLTGDQPIQSRDTTEQRPAIVTVRRMPTKILPPGLLAETEEEANRRADAADALWRELVRRVAEKP
jgi:hypothetical protein